MYLGLIVFLIVGVAGSALAIKGVKALARHVMAAIKREKDEGKEKGQTTSGPVTEDTVPKEEGKEQSPEEILPEETRNRYAAAVSGGIDEVLYTDETPFRIDGKVIADSCVGDGPLTYLEYSNRELTGDEFHGFNLIVEEGSRMVLTYGGVAVATLSRTERACTATINGEEVTGTMPAYRTNTFPPELRPGMVASDLERMLEASLSIRKCGGNPEEVSRAMVELFKGPGNVSLLKAAIDRKIQAKESLRKGPRSQKPQRSPTSL